MLFLLLLVVWVVLILAAIAINLKVLAIRTICAISMALALNINTRMDTLAIIAPALATQTFNAMVRGQIVQLQPSTQTLANNVHQQWEFAKVLLFAILILLLAHQILTQTALAIAPMAL